jgi:hypothetical protein
MMLGQVPAAESLAADLLAERRDPPNINDMEEP